MDKGLAGILNRIKKPFIKGIAGSMIIGSILSNNSYSQNWLFDRRPEYLFDEMNKENSQKEQEKSAPKEQYIPKKQEAETEKSDAKDESLKKELENYNFSQDEIETIKKYKQIKSNYENNNLRIEDNEKSIESHQEKKNLEETINDEKEKEPLSSEPVKVEVDKPIHVKIEKEYKHFIMTYIKDKINANVIEDRVMGGVSSFDNIGNDKGGYSTMGMGFFLFPDVALGVEYSMPSFKIEGDNQIQFPRSLRDPSGGRGGERYAKTRVKIEEGSVVNLVGSKYFKWGDTNPYLQTGFGFGRFILKSNSKLSYYNPYSRSSSVLVDEEIETPISGTQLIFRLGVDFGKVFSESLLLGLHINYTTPIRDEFKIASFTKPDTASAIDVLKTGRTNSKIEIGKKFNYGLAIGFKF